MAKGTRDARLEELALLAELARAKGFVELRYPDDGGPRRLATYVLERGFACVQGSTVAKDDVDPARFAASLVQLENTGRRDLLAGLPVMVSITHAGRVRMAELAQAVLSTRKRDPFGIVWDRYHLAAAVELALRAAEADALPSVAMLDLNGLREINASKGSTEAGDRAIVTFQRTLVASVGLEAEAYAGQSGGQAYVVLSSTSLREGIDRLTRFLKDLAAQKIPYLGTLTAACGVVAATSPATPAAQLIAQAEEAQGKAKAMARSQKPKPSVIAAAGAAPLVVRLE
jgi:diguanylate cyclase (GGDEF)-like protein